MSRATTSTHGDPIERAATWAARLAEGPLPLAQQIEFEAWLNADAARGLALQEILGAWDTIEHYAASEPMMALRQAALASARRNFRGRVRSVSRMWGVAGLIVAVLVVGAWVAFSPTVYVTGIGERRVIVLADGSRMSLDAATTVRVRFTGKERRLWLERGRAQFEVAKNPLRPFSVQAADNVVVATGTAFSVELLQRHVRVVLYEGHVALLQRTGGVETDTAISMGANPAAADSYLAPGREIILPEKHVAQIKSVAPRVEPADPVLSLSWEAGELSFDDDQLDAVTERMNRYSARPLVIADKTVASLRISGIFRAGDTDAFLQGLDAAFGIKSRSEANGILLFKGAARNQGGLGVSSEAKSR